MKKTVLINGGSRGIGRAMVELFCENGYSVAFTYKSSDEAAKELSARTGALAIKADSSRECEVLHAVDVAEEKLGFIEECYSDKLESYVYTKKLK